MKPLDLENAVILKDMEEICAHPIDWTQFDGCSFYITGAAGMIASYFTLFLIYLNEKKSMHIEIHAGIRNPEKARARFGLYADRPYFHIVSRDACDPNPVDAEIHYIIHAASLASPQYYGSNPVETALPNTVGTQALLNFARKQKDFRGFLFFSSGSVYGKSAAAGSIREEDLGTLDFLNNGNSYAESKRCGEMFCHAYASEYGLPARSVRIHHTYGPTMDIEKDKRAFSEFVKNVLEKQDIVLNSDGSARRAFCYITDTVSGFFSILANGNAGESYNIGNPSQYLSIRALAELLVRLSANGQSQVIVNGAKKNDPGYKLSPEADARIVPVSVDKLNSLGWSYKVTAEEGFGRVLDYFQS